MHAQIFTNRKYKTSLIFNSLQDIFRVKKKVNARICNRKQKLDIYIYL